MPLQSLQSLQSDIAGEVYTDAHHRGLYSTDASLYQVEPLAVVVPRTRDDVAVALNVAAREGLAVIPRGGGTSLSGQSIGPGIVLDFSKYLNRIVELDPVARLARVEPGVVLDQLNRAAAAHGLQFGPDVSTSSRANLGGMIGNNSAGSRSVRWGKTVDHVVELDVLLAEGAPLRLGPRTAAEVDRLAARDDREGRLYRDVLATAREVREEIVARYPRIVRRVSGYNLDELLPEFRAALPTVAGQREVRAAEAARWPGAEHNLARLVVGSEGTLATVVEALVHLVPVPRERALVVLEFATLADSVAAVVPLLEATPSAIEMFDGLILRLARENLEYRHYLDFVEGDPESVLIVELSGDDTAEVRARAEAVARRGRAELAAAVATLALDRRQADHIWACRKAAMPLLMSIPGARKPITFVEDCAVDPARLAEFVSRFRALLRQHGTDGAYYGHASVGCLHIRPLLDTSSRDDVARLARISSDVADLVVEFGGAMSGEHGDGLARSYLNERLFGPALYAAFERIKAAFDPTGRMNPGKVVAGPPPTESLRRGPETPRLQIATRLSFAREGGLLAAAEACNGSGVCRKTQTGTMCPSFMATGDEEHSTRGRANALRLILSGQAPREELTGERLRQTFSLCLQCKGCKAECPSNVDVAKMKVEFLHHYHAAHGTPLGARLMARIARLNRWGSALAPVSNWLPRLPGAAWLLERWLGIDRRRPLPRFARHSFARWFDGRSRPDAPAPRGPIVLLDDCLTGYCEPQVNQAAVRVLEAAGFEVHRAALECCGRAAISKGLLDEAARLARENLARLTPWVERGAMIVGSEPSCLLTLVDEYRDLVPGPEAERVAAAARLVEHLLIEREIDLPWAARAGDTAAGGFAAEAGAAPAPLVYHGHCYQKALVGVGPSVELLRRVAGGATVEVVDSGCCGMAGSFGYEHYDLSQQIGEGVLFPAVRRAAGAVVIAPGFSCRHQIHHGTGRRALHPLEYLAARLGSAS